MSHDFGMGLICKRCGAQANGYSSICIDTSLSSMTYGMHVPMNIDVRCCVCYSYKKKLDKIQQLVDNCESFGDEPDLEDLKSILGE